MDQLVRDWTDRGLGLEPEPVEVGSAQVEALERGALLVPLVDTRLLVLRGDDRVDFLHGQVSNDVRGLQAGATNRSLLLNHRGHALAEMRVFRHEAELQVSVDGGALDVVEESLRRHIIFDQVVLERPEGVGVLTLQGPTAGDLIASVLQADPPAEGHFVTAPFEGSVVTVSPARRTAAGGFDLLAPDTVLHSLAKALIAAGATPGGRPTLELGRVLGKLPAASSEGGDGILPQEAGLEPLVSYRKGCYLGQEIMARIEARGKLRRELAALELAGPPAEGERDITAAGKVVGRLGRVVRHPQMGYLALAVLRSDLAEDATLEVAGVGCEPAGLPSAGTSVTG